ncbi:hypothetical protein KTD31_29340 [Burkholderia multivorans]|nr:hypothetical protein [Burkholderia multivorans]MCO8353478.1 hypothetical protein [Burkholderia multivorans]MCO8385737.1 hypothetical protein [Burkholderia multivorans]MCO8406582.1 hypothetical protein [Burkholderia multivorans]MCO8434833.1 hypothetical protein [Burkholderia multivorans]
MPGRKPLSKIDLLPLPAAKVRSMSLGNHMAFAVVKAGKGSREQASVLLRMIYLAYYLREEVASGRDVELYCQAERALEHCIECSVQSNAWMLTPEEQEIVGRILSLHDAQLAVVAAHRYVRAWERLQAFLTAGTDRSIVS